jgi:hypothetical protein
LCSIGFVEAAVHAKGLYHATTASEQVKPWTRHGLGIAITSTQVNTAIRRRDHPERAHEVLDLDHTLSEWKRKNGGKTAAVQKEPQRNKKHTLLQRPVPHTSASASPSTHVTSAASSSSSPAKGPETSPKDLIRQQARFRKPPPDSTRGQLEAGIEYLEDLRLKLLEGKDVKDSVLSVLSNPTLGKQIRELAQYRVMLPSATDWERELLDPMAKITMSSNKVGESTQPPAIEPSLAPAEDVEPASQLNPDVGDEEMSVDENAPVSKPRSDVQGWEYEYIAGGQYINGV